MGEDIKLAFDTVEARSLATAGDLPLDRIAVRDYAKSVEIGAFQSERNVMQGLRFNVVLEVARHDGAQSDDVDAVLSYDTITEAIEAELAAERLNLLETLAERVADRILQHALAMRVFVRIEKTERGPGSLGVEIVREQTTDATDVADVAVHPVVVFCPNEVAQGDTLSAWVDAIERMGKPVVLCLEAGVRGIKTGDVEADQRLDLLAIEQNAWVLAARDPRCVVVGTRTEMDWALKNGQLSIWAPSRIVMDAVERPATDDPVALARWLAQEFDAEAIFAIGSDADTRLDVVSSPAAL